MPDRNIDGLEQLFALEEKVTQTIELLKSTTSQSEQLQRDNAQLRQECKEQGEAIEKLEDQLARLEKERETVRMRVQRLLDQIDSLATEKAAEKTLA